MNLEFGREGRRKRVARVIKAGTKKDEKVKIISPACIILLRITIRIVLYMALR
jgi:hypothetical protein